MLAVVVAASLVGLAGWIVAVRGSFAAIVGLVALGLVEAFAWVRLGSLDVALTEAAVGCVTGVLLIGAASRLRPEEPEAARPLPSAALRRAAAALCGAAAVGLAAVVLVVPDPAPSSAPLALANLPRTGLEDPVSAVLIAFRAVDTLLEVVVLALALVGVWSLAPDSLWGGAPRPASSGRPQPALALLARLLVPVGVLTGVYVFAAGSAGPGGEFQGATILAAMWLLLSLAGLGEPPATGQTRLRLALVAGPAIFLAVGVAGFAWTDGFLSYPEAFAKPLIVGIESALVISIAAAVFLLATGAPASARRP